MGLTSFLRVIVHWVHSVTHINLLLGALTLFFFWGGGERGHVDWPITNFSWNIGHSSLQAPLWTPSPNIETNVLPYGPLGQIIYMRVELWAKL
jgi:hypothetical protein